LLHFSEGRQISNLWRPSQAAIGILRAGRLIVMALFSMAGLKGRRQRVTLQPWTTPHPERGSIDTARAAWSTQRHDDNASRREAVAAIVRSGVITPGGIAKALQDKGVPTPSGATK
jgi:hypothetical protein